MRVRGSSAPFTLLAACVILAGCSSVVSGHGTVPTQLRPRSSSSTVHGAPASFSELAALLISEVPAGFRVQPDSVGDTGPSDLAKAIRDDGRSDAARVLTTDRFVRGYQRLWMNAAGDQIIVFLYQFAAGAGATAYYHHAHRLDISTAPADATRFVLPGLPASRSIGIAAHATGHAAAVADAVRGPFVMRIVCNARSGTGLKARLIAIARQQFTRL